MPSYSYLCRQCGKDFSVRRTLEAMDDPADCPECGSADTKRQLSIFYATNTGSSTAAASSPKTRVRHV